jgi:transcription-repair coupling factor (superfamily II helicase)
VENLFVQIRVKLLAEKAGLASVSVEGDQLVLRFPPLPEGITTRDLPPLSGGARAGKNAYWVQMEKLGPDWQGRLIEMLAEVAGIWQAQH